MGKYSHLLLSTSRPLECTLNVSVLLSGNTSSALANTERPQGTDLLENSRFNKGTSFTAEERETFGLHGLLPPNVQCLEEQVQRAYDQYQSRDNALAKNTFMTSMYEQNEVLFFKVRLYVAV